MLTCPMCKKKLRGLEKECLNCRTDVSLLVNYVEELREGLSRAEALTRAGELGEAVWAYLTVLEVDPDNATARKQVGQVATAVRQFDQAAPARRWVRKQQKRNRFRHWMSGWSQEGESGNLLSSLLWFVLVFAALMIGYVIGARSVAPQPGGGTPTTANKPPPKKPADGQDAGKSVGEKPKP